MADDALTTFVQSVPIRDKEALRFVIIDAIQRIQTREREEDARDAKLTALSQKYLREWTFDTITVTGRFPPSDHVRLYDGVIESSGVITKKYSMRPHIRIIMEGPRGTQFKMAVVLMCKHHLTQRELRFSHFELHVAVEAVPTSLGADVQTELVRAAFAMLRAEHPRFLCNMKRYCGNLEDTVTAQIGQPAC